MENHAHLPASDDRRHVFMRRTVEAMFPHYMTILISDEPVVRHGSDEYNARVWFRDRTVDDQSTSDIVVSFRWFTPNVQITTTVNS